MPLSSLRALALETTTRHGEVALVEGGRVVALDAFAAGLKQAAHLLPLIDKLCKDRNWPPGSIEEVYVSVGPGGFTGTRIGVTFAKTLAFATGARVVAVPTPRVIVENLPEEAQDVLVVIDARRGKAWVEPFTRRQGAWQPSSNPKLTTLAEALAEAPRPVWLIGEGLPFHADAIDAADRAIHVSPNTQPRAAVVAEVGWRTARGGLFSDPFSLAPAYVRRPEAEEKRLGLD